MKVIIPNIGNLNLTDKNYVGAGGEASVYQHGKYAVKIYHERDKMIPDGKIFELKNISANNVLKPLQVVYDSNNKLVGYVMDFVKGTNPICRLFTKSFKKGNNISHQQIIELVKAVQETIAKVHSSRCLIVDLNELNILVSKDFKIPYFIDTDSYQTPSYKATAIMDSIRDRSVPYGQFSELTDWYAFGILAFQLYIGIHPYKGKHPEYNPSEWQKRMDDGVSVFDPNASLPSVCNNFSYIPTRHRIWMEDVFLHNNRSVPPQIDMSQPITFSKQISIIKSDENFNVNIVFTAENEIISVFDFMGNKFFVSRNAIQERKMVQKYIGYDKIHICSVKNEPVEKIKCLSMVDGETNFEFNGKIIGSISPTNVMYKDGHFYAIYDSRLVHVSFVKTAAHIVPTQKPIGNISELSSKVFDGVIYQDLLGKAFLSIPEGERCYIVKVPELDGKRVIDMKMRKNFLIGIVEESGKFHRYIFVFNDKLNQYDLRVVKDVPFENINFVVNHKGVCVLVYENTMELFRDNTKAKVISNSPVDSSKTLYSFGDKIYFIEDKRLYTISLR